MKYSFSEALRNRMPSAYSIEVLSGLQDKPLYQGTVPPKVKMQRRAANRRARQSRIVNRRR